MSLLKKFLQANLKEKLTGFVGLTVVLVVAIMAICFIYYGQIQGAFTLKGEVNLFAKRLLDTRLAEKLYLSAFSQEYKIAFDTHAQEVNDVLNQLKRRHMTSEQTKFVDAISGSFEQYRSAFASRVELNGEQDKVRLTIKAPQDMVDSLMNELTSRQAMLQMDGKDLGKEEIEFSSVLRDSSSILYQIQLLQSQYVATGDKKYFKALEQLTKQNLPANRDTFASAIYQYTRRDLIENATKVKDSLKILTDMMKKSLVYSIKEHDTVVTLDESGRQIMENVDSLLTVTDKYISSKQGSALVLIILTVLVALFVFGAISVFVMRSITVPIYKIVDGLMSGAKQVATASKQVSAGSQSLAQGTSSQAASLEETSASLVEMSDMTKKNADNAQQTQVLMQKANVIVDEANAAMNKLTHSMSEISQASEETANIIKTIDAISFQTNLLALNAAVEAARAGEAGAGFAVVANEVKNLAMRTAEATKTTANLIENTTQKVRDGALLVQNANTAFSQVVESSGTVKKLVGEITDASKEQAQRIEQINIAVTKMNEVVQQNSANAEESASASEEMSAQAEQMREFIDQLVIIVGQNSQGRSTVGAMPGAFSARRPVGMGVTRMSGSAPRPSSIGASGPMKLGQKTASGFRR